jgi:IS30 family transposase
LEWVGPSYLFNIIDYPSKNRRFQLEKKTGFSIYFAGPYSAWQRGSNENTNGLISQYFPKGTDFKDITNKDLAFVVKKLNHRPRKCLNYQTPHEAFYSAIRGALAA